MNEKAASKSLDEECDRGSEASVALIEHLRRMGASSLEIPVTVAGRKWIVRAGPAIEAHDSDCSTNNRGCPELLGPCDCGRPRSTL